MSLYKTRWESTSSAVVPLSTSPTLLLVIITFKLPFGFQHSLFNSFSLGYFSHRKMKAAMAFVSK